MENWSHSGINIEKLKQEFYEFKSLPFPEPPDDDSLYDLYSELVELDAYVAGIISSFISGQKIDRKLIYLGKEFDNKLASFIEKRNEKILFQYKLYKEKIDNLITMIIYLYDNK